MPSTIKLARLGDAPEIFHTLQGEGVSMGKPAVFIRASLCNLHCQWCDTDYTWNWQGTPWTHERDVEPGYKKFRKEDCIVEMDIADVAQQVLTYNCPRVILTGGEPLLQDSAWALLLENLTKNINTLAVEVETNGTRVPSEGLDRFVTQYNVSPKLENSGNSTALREVDEALTFFAQSAQSEKAWFKFVVAAETDLDEIQQLIKKHHIDPEKVLLMPEGRTEQQLQARRLWLADACKNLGFRYSDRLHIQLWGSRRGV